MSEPVHIVDPITDERWRRLVSAQQSDVFHSPQWLSVLSNTYGFPLHAAVIGDDNGTPRAGMVYAEIEDLMDPRIVSLPFSDFCDPIVSDQIDWNRIVDGLAAGGRRIHLKCLRSRIPTTDERFEETSSLFWHAVDTTRDTETIWDAIDPSARRAIRKARSAGVEVRTAESVADVRAFYELHLRVRKHKYGLLAQPFSFFEHIWTHFLEPGTGMLQLAVVDDSVVGGVMFLEWKDTLYYKFNASDVTTLSVRPNDFVLWTGIEEAHKRGLAWLDFGVSDTDQEGLVRYKRKYATAESTVIGLRAAPSGSPSQRERAARGVLNELTRMLVSPDVPDGLTEQAGTLLYRYFT